MSAEWRAAAPALAEEVGRALVEYTEPGTRRTYNSATWTYVNFCWSRSVEPWPVTRWSFCLWMWNVSLFIALSSLTKVYMGAVKSSQQSRCEPWTLDKDPMVRRVVIALKKKYGLKSKRKTAAMTLGIIWRLARALKGFPVAASMSHDDRLWLFASVMGCLGLLRGGEFLVSPKQSRPVLMGRDIVAREVVSARWAVVVDIPKPKARWWELHMPVTIFGLPGTPLDVVQLLLDYRNFSVVSLRPGDPALRMADGGTLSKQRMFSWSERKLFDSSVYLCDELGRECRIGAKAWRYGGSASHDEAMVKPKVKQATGRWASDAVLCYAPVPQSCDFLQATQLIWDDVARKDSIARGVGKVRSPSSDVMDDDTEPLADRGVQAAYLSRAQKAPLAVSNATERKVGDRVVTKWGIATIVSEHADGGFECSWEHEDGTWRMNFHDEDDPTPDARHGKRKRLTSEVSSVV